MARTEFADRRTQLRILADGSRDELIAWLVWNDPNGVWADAHSAAEGMAPITAADARRAMARALAEEVPA